MPIDLEIQLHSIDELLCRIEKLEKKQESKNENKSKIQKVNKALPTYLLQHLDKSSKNLKIA